MSRLMKMLLVSFTVASAAATVNADASEIRSVACTVTVDYLLNGVLRAPYRKDFVVNPGEFFQDDFSTFTRFRAFEASTRLETGNTVVAIDYFNDVGVFESVDLSTTLTLRDNDETISGSHSYFTSLGIAGEHTTNYTLACRRL
ncbi:MAG TPA: hypothetical protein VFV55_01230 [Usitatibacteraceae bacterium]|nr:hypothetical protein [Usitatibacteraceae bacterium]